MSKCNLMILSICVLAYSAAFAKDAGDLLKQYMDDPKDVANTETLALVEVVSVETDETPNKNWKQSGVLRLKTIEAVGNGLPEKFSVRFYKRHGEGEDAWTWDYVVLRKGKKLLGFFNQWQKNWEVRKDGRTNVINNPENIEQKLLRRTQALFKTPLLTKTEKK